MGFWEELECEKLFDIPIEELELMGRCYKRLKKRGVSSVGDCIQLYVKVTRDKNLETDSVIRLLIDPLHLEIQLKEKGFWVYIERCYE
jgi:hypothetical protein